MKSIKEIDEFCRLHNVSIQFKNYTHLINGFNCRDYMLNKQTR